MSNKLDRSKFHSCSCGVHVESDQCQVTHKYTLWGWFLWTMGTTAVPKKIIFKCLKCNNEFETLIDPKLIKYFIFYRRY